MGHYLSLKFRKSIFLKIYILPIFLKILKGLYNDFLIDFAFFHDFWGKTVLKSERLLFYNKIVEDFNF